MTDCRTTKPEMRAIGVASVWVILNFTVFLFEIPIMHRRILRGEEWKWDAQDVLFPLMASLLIAAAGRILMPLEISQLMTIIYLGGCFSAVQITIGKDIIFGRGLILHNDIPANVIVIGNPTRPMRRNIDKKIFKK